MIHQRRVVLRLDAHSHYGKTLLLDIKHCLSDGAPNESVETVRQAVLDVEKQGFAIVAVSIEPQYDPSLMYHRNVNLTDMSRLAVDLGKMVKKAIADNTNRKIQ